MATDTRYRAAAFVTVPPSREPAPGLWERAYVRSVVAADAIAASIAAAMGFVIATSRAGTPSMASALQALALPFACIMAIAAAGGVRYERRSLEVGPEEYRRVALGAFGLMAFVGILAWDTETDIARTYVIVALPTACLLTWIGRYAIRRMVQRRRRRGKFLHRTLILGDACSVDGLAARMANSGHGYLVLGACVPGGAALESSIRTSVAGASRTSPMR